MHVNVQIQLGSTEYAEDLAGNATELAEQILSAIGGDESKDSVSVHINDSGMAGNTGLTSAPTMTPESEPNPETEPPKKP